MGHFEQHEARWKKQPDTTLPLISFEWHTCFHKVREKVFGSDFAGLCF